MKLRIIFPLSVVGMLWHSYAFTQETAKIIINDSLKSTIDLQTITITSSCEKHESCDFGVLPSQNSDAVVSQFQGVSLIRRGNYAAEPTFRGMSAGQLSITIDGMKIFGACTDKMDPVSSYVSSNNLQSITVSSNSTHSNHGSNVGGGFDFQTKQAHFSSIKHWDGEAGVGYETNGNGRIANFNLNYGDSAWALNLNANYQKFANYRAGGGEEISYSQFEKVNFALTSSWMLSPNQILKAQLIYDDAYNVGYPALPMDVSFAGGRIYSVSHQKYFAKGDLLVKAYGNNITHIMDDTKRDSVPMHMDMPGYSNTYGIFAIGTFQVGTRHVLTINPEYYQNTSFADMKMYPNDPSRPEEPAMYMVTWPDVKRHSVSLLAADKFQVSQKDRITVSSKYEFVTSKAHDEYGLKQLEILGQEGTSPSIYYLFSGDAAYSHSISSAWSANIQIGYAERQPTVSEGFGYYLFNSMDGYDYIGMPDLAKERALKLNVGAQWNSSITTIEGQLFHYKFKDYIIGLVDKNFDGMTIGSNGVKIYSNIPSASISGFELTIQTSIYQKIRIENKTQYTYGIDNEGIPLQMIPPLQNTTKIAATLLKIDFRVEAIVAALQNNPRQIAGETTTPSYALMNIYGQKNFSLFHQQMKVAIGMKNIFDANYWDHLDWNSIPRPGRSIVANLQMNF